jgi:hypothetical protein
MADGDRHPDISALVGITVGEICVSFPLRMIFEPRGSDEPFAAYVSATRFRFVDRSGREHHVHTEKNPVGAGPVLSVLHHKVATAVVDNWELQLTFDDGSCLLCAPDPNYEAWEVVSPGLEAALFCPVGGGE